MFGIKKNIETITKIIGILIIFIGISHFYVTLGIIDFKEDIHGPDIFLLILTVLIIAAGFSLLLFRYYFGKLMKSIATGIILTGLCVLIFLIYLFYPLKTIQNSDVASLILGSILVIVGLGIFKIQNWARQTTLPAMIAHLSLGFFILFQTTRYVLLPFIAFDAPRYIIFSSITTIAIDFIFYRLIPTVFIFYFLNRKDIKELFKNKAAQNQPVGELAGV